MQCNAVQHNTLQYNAMQCNAMQWHSPALEKTLCHAPFLAYGVLGRSPCHPAPSSEHTVPFFTQFCLLNGRLSLSIFCECNSFFFFYYRFVYKTTAMPNPKKNAVLYTHRCTMCSTLAMPSSRGGRSEAQQNAPRQGL